MAQVETVRGPVDVDTLGRTLMHEHVFVLNEEVRQNYPADWAEDDRVDDAIAKLSALAGRGCQTIVDPTVLGLGRDIQRIRRVADGTELSIIVATGLYTYNEVPLYFKYRTPGADGVDPMTQLFIGDITTGIAGTGIKAAFLKCAIDDQGMTPGVERVMRAVARAHAETGAPVTVHTHPHSGTGRDALRVLREEGADLTKVVLGHSGDSTDLDYLSELADAGCLLGMDVRGPRRHRRRDVLAWVCRQHGAVTRRVLLHRLVPAGGRPAFRTGLALRAPV
jgi:phosphotriesterase-related protein